MTATGKDLAKTKGKHEVATLADGELFVRRDGAGVIRPFWKQVTLKKGRDTYQVSGKTHISHMGFKACNVIANLSIMRPNTLFVEAAERSNPYIERNPHTQEAVNVHARSLAIGFAPTGNPVVVDKTVILNLKQYLITDLKNKINKHPECGYFGQSPFDLNDPAPQEWKSKDGKEAKARPGAVMKFIPTNEIVPGEYVGYWFDVAHPEIIGVFEQQRTRQQFAERNAISMSSRNAMAEHPCMPPKDVTAFLGQGGDAVVTVYGYRHDASGDDLRGLAQTAADGDLTGIKKKAFAETQLVDGGTEQADYEEVQVEEESAAEEAAEPEKEKKKTTQGRKKAEKKAEEPISAPPPEEKEPEKASEPVDPAANEEKAPVEEVPEPEEKKIGEWMATLIEAEQEHGADKITEVAVACGFEVTSYLMLEEGHAKKVSHAVDKLKADKQPEKAPCKAHVLLESAERIMKTPEMINEVAHEIFPDVLFEDWKQLSDKRKEQLYDEMAKRTG